MRGRGRRRRERARRRACPSHAPRDGRDARRQMSLIASTTSLGAGLGHRADPNAAAPARQPQQPRYSARDHRARRPARPPAAGRAHGGPDALAAPRPAGRGIPADITAEGALADLRAAGAHAMVNLLFPLRAGEAEELHRFGAELSRSDRERDPASAECTPRTRTRSASCARRSRSTACAGLKLHPMVQRFSPGHPALEPAIAALAEYALPLYVHTGFDEWYGWGYDLGELERIAERHPSIPLVLCHCAFPRSRWADRDGAPPPAGLARHDERVRQHRAGPARRGTASASSAAARGSSSRPRPTGSSSAPTTRRRWARCDGAARPGRSSPRRRVAAGAAGRECRALRARSFVNDHALDLERARSPMERASDLDATTAKGWPHDETTQARITGRPRDRTRLHGHVRVLRDHRRGRGARHDRPRARARLQLPRHRRDVRPATRTRSWSARRSPGRRDDFVDRDQVGHPLRADRGEPDQPRAGRLARERAQLDRGLAEAARHRPRRPLVPAPRRLQQGRSRRPSARWPSWSRRARCATSG